MIFLFSVWVVLVLVLFVGYWLFGLLGYFFTLNLLFNYWGFGESVFIFDKFTVSVLVMLGICYFYVYFYTNHYFGSGSIEVWLNIMICLFVGIMASLVSTGDYLLTLVFWEYLGVVSFFLILFYDSYLSLRASVITLVSSRFGDVCLFLLLCVSSYYLSNSLVVGLVLFFLIVFTKSASFPFISWLLEAMRAPTPVSSLVHSSTLVAAGVWFSIRYDILLCLNNSVYYSSLLITILITGICSLFYYDLKKIVALSTCNNISWCLLYLVYGDLVIALYQLISHGVSKCMLFILVGDVMSGAGGAQASNCVYGSRLYSNWSIFSLFCVILGLSGAPFIGVFFTKHFLLTNFMVGYNIILVVFVLSLVLLSYLYSFRLCVILVSIKSSVVLGVLYFFNSGVIVYIWLFVNYFIFFSLDEKVLLNNIVSGSLLIFQLVSVGVVWFMYNSLILSKWSSSLFGCDNIVELCYSLFFKIINVVSFMFYRWDSYILYGFGGKGSKILNMFDSSMLNITILLISLCLVCFSIIY
uniref:NADH:ubiquinone reductase (H(+)-translocating) n=1 Tax=Moniezia sp. MN-2015 TaxID=1768671 RepID=A0A7R6SZF9_9CEST|nr:NADH dehydrogenase subunit 5 [Moniezia sp. MN-2015]